MNPTSEQIKGTPPGAGHSSFDLIEAEKLFKELPLGQDIAFLDLGCGQGYYTRALAGTLGPEAVLYALDLWPEGIASLKEWAAGEGRQNLRAMVADISRNVPLPDASVDLALLATVLHDLVEFDMAAGALHEVHRVLKPGGTLAVVEFYQVAGPPGPPLHVRLTATAVEQLVSPFGFQKTGAADLGPYIYLIMFVKK